MSFNHLSILFTDELHFHERNFKSLFDFCRFHRVKFDFATTDKSWLSLYGNYASKKNNLRIYYDLLDGMKIEKLYSFKIDGFNVFELSRSELLSYLLPKDEWVGESVRYDYGLFEKIYAKGRIQT